jgi:uncharacterized protein YecT (DUF1311 family)
MNMRSLGIGVLLIAFSVVIGTATSGATNGPVRSLPSGARRPRPDQTQSGMNQESTAEYQRADAEMNRVYRQALERLKPNLAASEDLKKAQRAWVAFRDAHLESIYPTRSLTESGSLTATCRATELQELTLARLAQLRTFAEGIAEGDGCAGTRPAKNPPTSSRRNGD